jgi:hypothetical protein
MLLKFKNEQLAQFKLLRQKKVTFSLPKTESLLTNFSKMVRKVRCIKVVQSDARDAPPAIIELDDNQDGDLFLFLKDAVEVYNRDFFGRKVEVTSLVSLDRIVRDHASLEQLLDDTKDCEEGELEGVNLFTFSSSSTTHVDSFSTCYTKCGGTNQLIRSYLETLAPDATCVALRFSDQLDQALVNTLYPKSENY